jgi:hypothetical protein
MVKLGEVRTRTWERISFREWCLRGYAHSGRFPVRVIFPPNKFPSFSLIFLDEKNGMEVRMSIQAQKFKEAMNALGLGLKKTDLPAMVVEVETEGDAVMYGLDTEKENPEVLEWRGSFWLRRKKESEPWDDSLTENF